MTIAKGRTIKVDGETFVWKISKAEGQLTGTSGKTARFTAQHGSRASMLLAKLTSRKWTKEHEWNLDSAPRHKVAFTPEDAANAIRAAINRGWVPKAKGAPFTLEGCTFTDYLC